MAAGEVDSVSDKGMDINVDPRDRGGNGGWRWLQGYMLEVVVLMYFFTYHMGTAMTEVYLNYRVTQDVLEGFHVKTYIDLADLSFCTINYTDPKLFYMVELQIEMAPWREHVGMASGIPALVTILLLGPLSDRFGRRFLFLLPICGAFFRAIGYIIINHWNLPLWCIYIPHALESFLGSFPAFLMAAFSYACDFSEDNKVRTLRFVILDALAYIGQVSYFFIVPLTKVWSYTSPNIITLIFGILTFLLVFFLLPFPRQTSSSQDSIVDNFKQPYRFFYRADNRLSLLCFHLCWFTFGITSLMFYGQPTIEPVYASVQPLCWVMSQSVNFLETRIACQGVAAILLVALTRRFLPDAGIAILAGSFQIAGFILEGFASTNLRMYMSAVLACFPTVLLSIVRVILSKVTTVTDYGSLFSVLAWFEMLTSTLAAVTFVDFYDYFLTQNVGAVFFLMAAMTSVVVILYSVIFIIVKKMRAPYITLP